MRGLSRPNPVSWFFWGTIPVITFFAQLDKGVGLVSVVTLVLGVTNISIMAISIYKNGLMAHLTTSTICCALAAGGGVVMWLITKEPEAAIVCSIIADIFACMPTLAKTYFNHKSEYAPPYLLSAIVMALTLGSVQSWHFAAYGFALYGLISNMIIYMLAITPYRPFDRTIPIYGNGE